MTLTFVDAGVLIAASRGQGDLALQALRLLDDPQRTFASSVFVKLEVLPLPTFHHRTVEVAFFDAYFESVRHWPASNDDVVQKGFEEAVTSGLAALDALHVAAARLLGVDVLVTTEKRSKAFHRVQGLEVHSLTEDLSRR
ncbi:MAG: type II toxin-antitoxin system VapC family toxin [Thermoanaerobaculia bacterium]|nr:type II toxin-antitoxin system VapC family toxin [Thermoanaerobaculia bacterium]